MPIQIFFLVVALVFFAFGTRWWGPPANPPCTWLVSGGLFFATLAWLWPMIVK